MAILAELRGGEHVEIQSNLEKAAHMRSQILEYLRSEAPREPTRNEVAVKFGLHRRTIQRIRAEFRAAGLLPIANKRN